MKAAFLSALQHQQAHVVAELRTMSKSKTLRMMKASKTQQVLAAAGKTDLTEVTDQITPQLTDISVASSHSALVDLGITSQDTFNVTNEAAADWANAWAAELVTAVSQTTRDELRDMVTAAFENGVTPADLADQIEGSFLFSEARSEMIASTEIARSQMQGIMSAWTTSDIVIGKAWVLSGDHDDDDLCNDNADQGIIPLDDDFDSGDDAPPGHPNCRCGLSSVLDGEENL